MEYGKGILPGLEAFMEESHKCRRDPLTAKIIDMIAEAESHFGVTNVSPRIEAIFNAPPAPAPD